MKKILLTYTLVLFSSLSFAGTINYTPTNFQGESKEVSELFDQLWSKFKTFDYYHCYRRAHVLANQMVSMGLSPIKVFFFKGNKETLDIDWYYHVAPAVYYKGRIVVLDKGLLPVPLWDDEWLKIMGNRSRCVEFKKYSDFKKEKENVPCGYIISSMYNYGPNDIDEDRIEFNGKELLDSMFSMRKRQRRKYQKLYPLAL